MSDERDPVVAKALGDIDVPGYEPGFFDRLDARLDRERAVGPVPVIGTAGDRSARGDTPIELDADPRVVPLAPVRRAPRLRAARLLAVAAAVAVAAVVAWQARPDGDELRTASPTQTAAPTTGSAAGTTDATASVPGPSAEADLRAWIEAIAAGDVDEAVKRTGPRTAAYYKALGADLRGVMVEYGEGYGAWADSPDLELTVLPLGEVGGQAVAAVVLSGTWNGEGGPRYRVEAIPVVQLRPGGSWTVEPAAFDPFTEGRLIVLSPPSGEDGLGGLPPEGTIDVSGDRGGAYWFSIDGAPPTRIDSPGGEESVSFDPDDDALTSGTHSLVVAQVDEQNITAAAGTFTVEG
ncbi:MAG: hypothetical protein Q8K58_00310 [Acidimicrobiales bacterium]|nr:hypothetical protein [Acidimicrobiales bacterium]